jgi:HEAT repeat protein
MKRTLCQWFGILAVAVAATYVRAGDSPPPPAELDRAFARLETYDWGQSRQELGALDQAIRASVGDAAARQQLENRLAAVLATSAPVAAKDFVCQRLGLIGAGPSVPALAALLPDPQLSHAARMALESIHGPTARQALRDALSKVEGQLKIGVINSLGNLEDAAAADALAGLLKETDTNICSAAAVALGHIGTVAAARTLGQFRGTAPEALQSVVTDAWLMAAERLAQTGHREEAAGIFHRLYTPQNSIVVCRACLRGLVGAEPEKAADLLAAALACGEESLSGVAAGLLANGPGAPPLAPFLEAFRTYPPPTQIAVLDACRVRGETSGRLTALDGVQSSNASVRLAALRALGVIGNAGDVPLLARLAAGGEDGQSAAARSALTALRGKDINAALIAELAAAPPETSREAIRALAERNATEAVGPIASCLDSGGETTTVAALDALAILGGGGQVPAIIKTLDAATTDRVRQSAEAALQSITVRAGAACADPLLAGLKDAKSVTRPVLLRALGVVGGAKALEAVRFALQDSDAPTQEAAFRVLTEWSGAEAAPDLLQFARTSANPNRALLAFRAYVRLCRDEQITSAAKLKMLTDALGLAKTVAQKRLVIAGLGDLDDPAALKLLEPFLADADLAEVAGLAIVNVAAKPNPKDAGGIGLDLEKVMDLEKVIKLTTNPDLQDQARKLLERLGAKTP